MRIRKVDPDTDPRMLTAPQAQAYCGMGRSNFRAWADQIGATRRFGGSVRFDRKVIDQALDEMEKAQ